MTDETPPYRCRPKRNDVEAALAIARWYADRGRHVPADDALSRLDGDGAHEAALDPASGAAGAPTPTELEAVYLAELRRGGPPPGWAARAREWGLNPATVARELVAARKVLEESRTPNATQSAALELTVQAGELADEIEALARAPLEREADAARAGGDLALVLEGRAKAMAAQTRALATVAQLKLKTASTLLAVHKTPPEPEEHRHVPDPNKLLSDYRHPGLSALKGTP